MADQTHGSDCVFCGILDEAIPAAVIFRDDGLMAFMDAFPASPGHALIIPGGHYPDIHATPADTVAAVAGAAKRLAAAQTRALEPEGISINQFNGAAAGQTVFHYHVHVIPRWRGDGPLTHDREPGDPATLRTLAERIRNAL